MYLIHLCTKGIDCLALHVKYLNIDKHIFKKLIFGYFGLWFVKLILKFVIKENKSFQIIAKKVRDLSLLLHKIYKGVSYVIDLLSRNTLIYLNPPFSM